ncbi:KpsF/GutQ family sugar-phosphate isomerase [Roseimaritima ulvae]|uniref:Arabinose 5-phosphate isomerase KdsD n=1 Tax=Roseimaritima ulvae TaxID=980254 RepID=A0A5B9QWR4_9BACT|nr:KpsF/GutQ family sugar-phosphate isomerase [Roseimaritima ulvae]QEG42230.1 Arabinose 5-phosphate isomerase KdsD [Roseimaritima ulvae]
MTEPAATTSSPVSPPEAVATPLERLRFVRQIVRREAEVLEQIAHSLTPDAVQAAEWTAETRGMVVVTGIGKAGLIGRKLVATLASTGTPAQFLHPSEAIHGDLGVVRPEDLVWVLSNSGRSDEVLQILPALRQQAGGLVAFTADKDNPVATAADCVVCLGKHREACPLGLAPSASTTAMLAVGDAVALLASQLRGFSQHDFAKFHPGGSLGKKLTKVEQLMRPLAACRMASDRSTVRETITATAAQGRRTGAVMLVDQEGHLAGLFTDSDLARLLESRNEDRLDGSIAEVMTRDVQTVHAGALLGDAIAVLAGRKISELPVVDGDGRPVGLLDITDVVSLSEPPKSTLPLRSRSTE